MLYSFVGTNISVDTFKINVPLDRNHTPALPKAVDPHICKMWVSVVLVPVRPVTVILDPSKILQSGTSKILMTFDAEARGLL